MTTDTLANGLKAVFGSTNNIQSSSLIPYADSSRNPAGFTDMSKLASVLGGTMALKSVNNANLDTITVTGNYDITVSPTNPYGTGSTAFMTVLTYNSYIYQRVVRYNQPTKTRWYWSGSWTEWTNEQ